MLGYTFRFFSAQQQLDGTYSVPPFIGQTVFILVAPSLFAASIYMTLGRIVELVDGDRFLFVNRRRLTATFVLGDVLSFLMQGGGKFHCRLLPLAPENKLLTQS
jgi:hypothetical protein